MAHVVKLQIKMLIAIAITMVSIFLCIYAAPSPWDRVIASAFSAWYAGKWALALSVVVKEEMESTDEVK